MTDANRPAAELFDDSNNDNISAQQSFQTFKDDEEQQHYNNAIAPGDVLMEKPDLSWPSIKHYAKTRFTELLPKRQYMAANKHLLNPLPALRLIGFKQWLMIFSAFMAWSWDAYDFFSVSLNTTVLAQDFDKNIKDITWGITVVLMLRSVGALIFGYFGDRYGRKWPLVANLLCVCFLEIGTGFIKTYKQFLGVRALFGIMLGGVYGNAAATALDDCPIEAKGFVSGVFQQGYAFGYLLAVVFQRAIADNSSHKWRAMFWFGSGVSFLLAVFRASLPETKKFTQQKEIQRYNEEHGIHQDSFLTKAKKALKVYWLMMCYMVILMAGFSFMSHGSQDLYPTLLTVRYDFSENATTVTNCLANIGAIIGGVFIGHISNFIGRRLSIIICCFLGGCMIYPWAFIGNSAINAGAFFIQFFVQGSFGVVPVFLSEMAPPDFRAFVVGLSNQLGNLASSASSTIETTIGERFPMISPNGSHIYDYAKVMAIFIACVFVFVAICVLADPETKPVTAVTATPSDNEDDEAADIEKIFHEENFKPNEGEGRS